MLAAAERPHPRALDWVPLGAGAAWAVVVGSFLVLRQRDLGLPAFDTAYFQQLVWGIFHGHPFRASFLPGNFLGLHFSPILVLPALVELAWPGTQTLNLLSAVSAGLAVPTAFLAARALLPRTPSGTRLAALVAVVLPFTPPLQESAWSGFHSEQLALPALLLATWAFVSGHRFLGWAMVAVALLTREDQAYEVLVLGLLLLRDPRHRRLGTAVSVSALVFGGVIVLVLMPWLRHGVATDTSSYYAWLSAGGPGAIFSSARLAAVVAAITQPAAWAAVGLTLAAFCLLPLLRPGLAALALPPLLMALLSRHQPQPQLQLQYGLPVVFPLVVAAALGGRRLLQWWRPRPLVAALAFAPGIAVGLTGSLAPAVAGLAAPRAPAAVPAAALAMVPPGAELDTDDDVAAASASRADLRLLPHLAAAAFVLVDTGASTPRYGNRAARDRAVAGLPLHRRLLWSEGRLQLWSPSA